MFMRGLQRSGTLSLPLSLFLSLSLYVYMWIYEELAHTIMEAEKSRDLLASWRPRKAGGVIQSKSEDLGTRRPDGANPSLGTGEDDTSCPSSNKDAGKKRGGVTSSLLCLLLSSDPQRIGRGGQSSS